MYINIEISGDVSDPAVRQLFRALAGNENVGITVTETPKLGAAGLVEVAAAQAPAKATRAKKAPPAAAPAPAVEAPAPTPIVAPVAAQAAPAAPQASVFSEEDVANATRGLAQSKGVPAATDLLKHFGIEKARELPAERREEYIALAKSGGVPTTA